MNRKTKRRMSASFAALACTLALLAGCAAGEQQNQSASQEGTTDVAASSASNETTNSASAEQETGSPDNASSTPPEPPEDAQGQDSSTVPEPPASSDSSAPPEIPDDQGADSSAAPEPPASSDDATPPEPPEGEEGQPPEPPEGAEGQPPEPPEGNGDQPPEPPEGGMPGSGEEPPAKPDGEPGENGEGGTPAEKPEGEAPGGIPGDNADGTPPVGGAGGPGGADTMNFDFTGTYTGALEADGENVTSESETISATAADQNAALAKNSGTLLIGGGTLTKSGDDTNGDNCNFYGINSILLSVGEKSQATITTSTLSADSEGSNGIFATDSGLVHANEVTVSTEADNARGLDATYGGTIVANSASIETQGDHCAGIATDRGGGFISATNSKIETNGSGSPILYSTGDIEVSNLAATANGSQIAGMEGLNSILVQDSRLTSTITKRTASDPVANGVIIYQSTSGDAEAATGDAASFTAVNSTLASAIESGAMFYLTNTTAEVVLANTVLDFDSDAASLIKAAGNDSNNWGSAGRNGAQVTFTAIGEDLAGNVEVDTISSMNLFLLDGTTWEGIGTIDENAEGSTVEEPLSINVDATSTWTVTEDCTVSNLAVARGGSVVDAEGDSVTIVAGGQTVIKGESSVTVTVGGSYATTVKTTDANEPDTASIDRSDFDKSFGTNTAFATYDDDDASSSSSSSSSASSSSASSGSSSSSSANEDVSSSSSSADEPSASSDDTPSSDGQTATTEDEGFFAWLWRMLTGLFG